MIREQVYRLVEDTARVLGYLLYDVSIYLKGENTRIIVKIDSLQGISHRDCEVFSREVSARLDGEDILPNYALEVSSPGIHRLVRNEEEFRRFIGAPVKIVYRTGDASAVVKGRIEEVAGGSVMIASDTGETAISFNAITSANLDY